mgnify:CR=1 FL=1
MPELPELEILRRDLDKDTAGKKIKSVEVTSDHILTRQNAADFASQLEGKKVVAVHRRATWIIIEVEEDLLIVIELGTGGQLRRHANKDAIEESTEINIAFTQTGQLRIRDLDGEAEVFVTDKERVVEELPALTNLGLDPVAEPISWTAFGRMLLERDAKLKAVLMDPTFLVGIGLLYSDEILFEAGLRYDRISSSLSTQEVRRLYRAVVEKIHDAMKYGGTTLDDGKFLNIRGEPGDFAQYVNVYGKHGEMSPRARGVIKRSKFAGNWTYYCEQTQV